MAEVLVERDEHSAFAVSCSIGARTYARHGRLVVQLLARAGNLFDDELRLSDEETREQLRGYLEAFVAFCAQQPRS